MIAKYQIKYLQLKNQFLLGRDWKELLIASHYILTIAPKNVILETTRILQIQYFFPS